MCVCVLQGGPATHPAVVPRPAARRFAAKASAAAARPAGCGRHQLRAVLLGRSPPDRPGGHAALARPRQPAAATAVRRARPRTAEAEGNRRVRAEGEEDGGRGGPAKPVVVIHTICTITKHGTQHIINMEINKQVITSVKITQLVFYNCYWSYL